MTTETGEVAGFMTDNKDYVGPKLAFLGGSPPGQMSSNRSMITVAVVLLAVFLGFAALKRMIPEQVRVYDKVSTLAFADPVLAECVRAEARANDWSDIGHFVSLRCNNPHGKGIRDLAGIEQLPRLRDIDLAFNRLEDVSVLAVLEHLRSVELSHNRIEDLHGFSFNPNLVRLQLNYNRLHSLDWLATHHAAHLESFAAAHNTIEDLGAIRQLDELRELNVRGNAIGDLGPVFELVNLEYLDAGGNQVDDVTGIERLADLRRLFIDGNRLKRIDEFAGLSKLEELDLADNPLQSVEPLAGLTHLERLGLERTGIEDLDVVLNLGDLEMLRVAGNPDLPCDVVAGAVAEYGERAVRRDTRCANLPVPDR